MSSQIYNFFPRNGLIYGEIFKVYLFHCSQKDQHYNPDAPTKKETIQPIG
jgi:hypothetical protein